MGIVVNTNDFIKTVSKVHNNFYGYKNTTYTKAHNLIMVDCPIHGSFSIRAYAHKNGQGCKQCHLIARPQSIPKSSKKFIEQATKRHNGFYEYDKINYVNNQTKITITCPSHGNFLQRPSQHLSGNGCPDCGNARKQFSKLPGMFYIVEMENKKECFLKIGITKNPLNFRYQAKIKSGYYLWKEVFKFNAPLNEAFKIEQTIKQQFKEYRYIPKTKFAGWTECFSKTPLEKILLSMPKIN